MDTLDAEKLITARRAIPVPFKLQVQRDDDTVELLVTETFRVLPGKRIVAKAELDGRSLLIKTFLGRGAGKYALLEEQGVAAVATANVRAPSMYWKGTLTGGEGIVLAFEFLDNASNLRQIWDQAESDDDKVDVLTRAMIIMAMLHNAGVRQADIHLNNFLLRDGKLYTIDGGGVVFTNGKALSEATSLSNLGLFFAQFLARYDSFTHLLLPAYEAVREWSRDERRLSRLEEEIRSQREERKKRFVDKAFRECTRFACESSFSRFQVCERTAYSDEMQALLSDPDRMIEQGRILKDGNSATVALVHLSDRSLVIKRYNIKGPWHGARRLLRKSRAWRSWRNAIRLEFLGIPALKPVAMLERRIGPLRTSAYLITEYIEAEDAACVLRDMAHPNGELEALARILQGLSEAHITHGDLKATNFLMAADGPVIIDLDAMHEHRNAGGFRRAFNKDLDRFMDNWHDNPVIEERFEGLLAELRC